MAKSAARIWHFLYETFKLFVTYAMNTASVDAVAGRHSERAAEHVPECDPLVQFEELVVDREGRVFHRRACLDGLARPAVCLSVRAFESGCVQKYASRRNGDHHSATGVC